MKVIYTWLIRLVSSLCYFRKKKNVYYLMSYSNNLHLIKRIAATLPNDQKLVVWYNPRVLVAAYDLKAFGIETIPLHKNWWFILRQIPRLMTARVLFCDNYYSLLAGLVRPKTKMKIVQLWHADGSIKRFGWKNPRNLQKSFLQRCRHQQVYNQFDEFLLSSPQMGSIFKESFALKRAKLLPMGSPRSDRLFSNKWLTQVQKRVYLAAPELKNKRVILYAPTFRRTGQINPPLGTIAALTADPDAIVAIKLYQEVDRSQLHLDQLHQERVKIYDEFSTTDLMTVADTFVTDYSSYAFDYSLMGGQRQAIFYMYDLDDFKKVPGIQPDFQAWLPTAPITTPQELAVAICQQQSTDFTTFNQMWNTYNDGHVYQRVLDRYVLATNHKGA
ncbi:glycerophosphotransferase [Fructilactobacillus florum 8D]|uniref:Glycerophosphotransferase n=1 Tax=Fructilactobacillus florum 8D TaxID=1221538 RepID=W9EFQ8_9LACO|nr:CDP-glycerol glycerophosphotransferase family protein [Fructilactobacillus florum]ETO40882.1 glycerophosphotransferase [Fructilactobacillus florum 8D]